MFELSFLPLHNLILIIRIKPYLLETKLSRFTVPRWFQNLKPQSQTCACSRRHVLRLCQKENLISLTSLQLRWHISALSNGPWAVTGCLFSRSYLATQIDCWMNLPRDDRLPPKSVHWLPRNWRRALQEWEYGFTPKRSFHGKCRFVELSFQQIIVANLMKIQEYFFRWNGLFDKKNQSPWTQCAPFPCQSGSTCYTVFACSRRHLLVTSKLFAWCLYKFYQPKICCRCPQFYSPESLLLICCCCYNSAAPLAWSINSRAHYALNPVEATGPQSAPSGCCDPIQAPKSNSARLSGIGG